MIRKKVVILVAVAAVAIALTAAAVFIPTNASADGYTMRANINEDCASAPWFVGDEKGYFNAHDVRVVNKGALTYEKQPYALITGKVDVLDASPTTLINLLRGGAEVSGVALSGTCPEEAGNEGTAKMYWIVSNNSKYHNVQDLVAGGQTPKIGVAIPGFCMELEASGWYEENGITMGDLEFVVIPNSQLENNLRRGNIDAAVLPQSFYDLVEGGVRHISMSSDTSASLGETSLIVFTDDFIKKNPDAVRAFIQAYKGAERWINDHPDEAAEITARAADMKNVAQHVYSDSGRITDDILQPWIDAMVKDEAIGEGEFVPSDLYTTEFSDLWVNSTGPQPLDPFPSSEHGASQVLDDEAIAAVRTRTAA